ncbi:hypothetical protein L0Y40_01610 [Candidatus Wolfebacteria bacterium]|nr:hypothetical protein [Candidatus Wolfebacteria bacterium]
MVKELVKCDTLEKRLIIGLVVAIVVLGGLYVYLVNETVRNVVLRREVEREMSAHASTVSDLELAHLGLKNAVTRERAHELGFRELGLVTYVSREPLALVASPSSAQR